MKFAAKHVLLMTSTNLASNPRCLKEVKLLDEMGVKVTVVAFNLHNWTKEKEIGLQKEFSKVHFNYLEATKHHFFSWIFSAFVEKISRRISPYLSDDLFLTAMAISKRSWILLQWLKKYKEKPDLIIAHNPAAFYPASRLAKRLKIPFAVDIEDYHPGEGKDPIKKRSITILMKELIPQAIYTTYASSLIKKYTSQLLLPKQSNEDFVINNTFPKSEFSEPEFSIYGGDILKVVWFSQFIDYGRGLEKILPVMDNFAEHIELTLIGNLRETFFQSELKSRTYIRVKPSLSQQALHHELVHYDCGLALEDKQADVNRNICLTNKIWAYFQAGLYILASDTAAQKLFIQEFPQHGGFIDIEEKEGIYQFLKEAIAGKDAIRSQKKQRFNNAQLYSWEQESQRLVKEWSLIFKTSQSKQVIIEL